MPAMLGLLLKTFSQLKPVTKTLLLYEELDIFTTLFGLTFFPEIIESNPLPGVLGGMLPTFLVKIIAVIFIAIVLERVKNWPRLIYVVPSIAALPVFWNILVIVTQALA
jgi:hypothetical protein